VRTLGKASLRSEAIFAAAVTGEENVFTVKIKSKKKVTSFARLSVTHLTITRTFSTVPNGEVSAK
jgi:hypothetical protein